MTRDMEIDWNAIRQYVKNQGWEIERVENPHLLDGSPEHWPATLQQLVAEQIKDGAKLQDIKYPVITANKAPTCAAGNEHYFQLVIYNDGMTEINTIIALADVDSLPQMLAYIDKTLSDHDE